MEVLKKMLEDLNKRKEETLNLDVESLANERISAMKPQIIQQVKRDIEFEARLIDVKIDTIKEAIALCESKNTSEKENEE